jgi:hypothetical protein
MKKAFLLCCVLLTAAVCSALAKAPEPLNDLSKTLSTAAAANKMTFILLGRATCGNCNATRSMIQQHQIPVTDADYVMADLNCDDPRINSAFMRKFGKETFGNTLPFVVVTDSHGKVLASSGGYKDAEQWKALLRKAKSKAATNPSADTAGGNWPFKSSAASPAPAAAAQ